MMTYTSNSRDNVKKHGEVFTPAGIVYQMVMFNEMRDSYVDVDKKIFDPAVGEGQFPCAELVFKMFCNLERLDEEVALRALDSLFAMDIQISNVDKAREHLLLTLIDAYKFFTGKEFTQRELARLIVHQNIMAGDTLKFMEGLKRPTLF